MIFVGIDPGKHGAIAWLDGERKIVEARDCPLVDGEYDFQAMRDLLSELMTLRMAVTIEAVHAMPTDGKCSAFSFGVGYGAWLALVGGVLRVRPTLVPPASWKRTMLSGLPSGKLAAVQQAERLFPSVASQLRGVRGGLKDGRAEALLLAEYGRRTYQLSGARAA